MYLCEIYLDVFVVDLLGSSCEIFTWMYLCESYLDVFV